MLVNEMKPLSNRKYFEKYCYVQDLCRIVRMWNKHLDATIGRDAPMYEKEIEYEHWLDEMFDGLEWEATKPKENTEHWW